jgi:phosphopantothenoylcysteine decarboxylase/phosphopantothenate--cysteine ligase
MTPSEPDESAARSVIVAVAGGIACYKTCTLVSRLAQGGWRVTVLMTEAATRFVTPLTFEALSGRPVYTSIWQQTENKDSQHIALARGADAMVLAPATANIIAKLAAGICDDVVTTVATALPRTTPVLFAPSMNAAMWDNPIVQRNTAVLRETLGWRQVGPDEGWQACRTKGAGRMAEPDQIHAALLEVLSV